jgi:hypothetical protein
MGESGVMARTVSILPVGNDRERLLAIAADRNRPLKHVQRAQIILFSAERLPVLEVARRADVSRPAVWRWQVRYAEQGVDGLLRDKTRKPGRTPLSAKVVARVLNLTCREPPGPVGPSLLQTSVCSRALSRTKYAIAAMTARLKTIPVSNIHLRFGGWDRSGAFACVRTSETPAGGGAAVGLT